jgi:hypothetical protein
MKLLRVITSSLFLLLGFTAAGSTNSFYLPQLTRATTAVSYDLLPIWTWTNSSQTNGAQNRITVAALSAAILADADFASTADLEDYQPLSADLTLISGNTTTLGRNLINTGSAASGRSLLDAQQLDIDLTALAALNTAAFGRSVLELGSAASGRTLFDAQQANADLTSIASTGTTSFGRSLLNTGNAASGRTLLDAQQADSDLTAIAALSTTSFGRSVLALADATAGRTLFDAQQADTDLTAIAALATSSYGRGLLTSGDAAAARLTLDAQQLDTDLTALAALSTVSYGRGLLEKSTAALAATYLGLGTGDSPQFTGINVGHGSDTPVTRSSAGVIAVNSIVIPNLNETHPTTTALTYSGTNVTLTASSRATYNRTLTLTNDCLLTITTTDGANGVITLVPDSSSTYTVYLASGIRMLGVAGGGSFAVTNSATETVVIAWQASLRGGSAFTAATKAVYP